MEDDIQECVDLYRQQLQEGRIQLAYQALMRYVMELKSQFPAEYSTGNISYGYLDYTYFPFQNAYLKAQKLRFGIVLNHGEMSFELWLMGQNQQIQKDYWQRLRDSQWNRSRPYMHQYAIIATCLFDRIDFNHKAEMTTDILSRATSKSQQIQLAL